MRPTRSAAQCLRAVDGLDNGARGAAGGGADHRHLAGVHVPQAARARRGLGAHVQRPDAPRATASRLDDGSIGRGYGAADGHKACAVCAFENFKRLTFCIACGTELPAVEPENTSKRRNLLKKLSNKLSQSDRSVTTELTMMLQPQEMTSRQQRAMRRREWTRGLNGAQELEWRRTLTMPVDAAPTRITPFIVRFHATMDEASPHTQGGSGGAGAAAAADVVRTAAPGNPPDGEDESIEVVVDTLAVVTAPADEPLTIKDVTCEFIEPTEANAAMFPLDDASSLVHDANNSIERRREVVELSAYGFPRKYVHFVASTGSFLQSDRSIARLTVNRDYVHEESMHVLACMPHDMVSKLPLRIVFTGDSGIDAGGVQREWFVLLNETLMQREAGVFVCANPVDNCLYLNRHSRVVLGEDHLDHFLAAGRLLGRALLGGLVVGFHLASPLLKLILGQPVTFEDFEHYDPDAYRNLRWLLDNDGADQLCLDFSTTEKADDGTIQTVLLVPNGDTMDVTDNNKAEYVERLVRYTLVESVAEQLYAFLKGVYDVIPQSLLMLYDCEELDFLLCGVEELDVDDWEANTKYTTNLYRQPVMTWFWELVREMPNEHRRRLLHFATGSSRVPLGGFKSLTSYDGLLSPFTLNGLSTTTGYIHSHACFNRLDLPLYETREELQQMLDGLVATKTYGFTTT